jgi:hypothetical protein
MRFTNNNEANQYLGPTSERAGAETLGGENMRKTLFAVLLGVLLGFRRWQPAGRVMLLDGQQSAPTLGADFASVEEMLEETGLFRVDGHLPAVGASTTSSQVLKYRWCSEL